MYDCIMSHSKVVPVLGVAPIDSTHILRGVICGLLLASLHVRTAPKPMGKVFTHFQVRTAPAERPKVVPWGPKWACRLPEALTRRVHRLDTFSSELKSVAHMEPFSIFKWISLVLQGV
jgi:hypothetical protein